MDGQGRARVVSTSLVGAVAGATCCVLLALLSVWMFDDRLFALGDIIMTLDWHERTPQMADERVRPGGNRDLQ